MIQLVLGKTTKTAAADALVAALAQTDIADALLYVGYPILTTADETIVADAMLISPDCGVVLFDIIEEGQRPSEVFWSERAAAQTKLYLSLESKLITETSLCSGRRLDVPIEVFTFAVIEPPGVPQIDSLILTTPQSLAEAVRTRPAMERAYLRPLNGLLQRVKTIKPPKKRESVTRESSRGAVIKTIESAINELDWWQNRAAIETPEGPQRIRGLAGSGKTIVLALKAAYLHAFFPDWTIGVTFYTQSLYEQFEDLIRRFAYQHLNTEPDWSKVRILHAWGSYRRPGVYSEIASSYRVEGRDLAYGKSKYGSRKAFEGICEELLQIVEKDPGKEMFDALLIDEAQDLPTSFFRLAFHVTREPKRIVWAYDEMQNLGDFNMESPPKLFGLTKSGAPKVHELVNQEGRPHQDIILPVCYRNSPWVLAVAHALGFGVYRTGGLIQMFDEPELWADIGYEVVHGELAPGKDVTVSRRANASPSFFSDNLKPEDSVVCRYFDTQDEQLAWVVDDICENLRSQELEASDFLVILADPLTVAAEAAPLMAALKARSVESHIAGVTFSRDSFFVEGSVAISGIYRAKGNEAPIVYVLNSEYCFDGPELIRRRNILFTAITRSRGWVRICGCGPEMKCLAGEVEAVAAHDYRLSFRVPTEEQLAALRRIHRDMTAAEKKRIASHTDALTSFARDMERGVIDKDALPKEVLERLQKLLREDEEP